LSRARTNRIRLGRESNGSAPALAAELVHRKVAVMFASGGLAATFAAKTATTAIPILFATPGDRSGLVLSLCP
jgi:putative ABC transport system substrate-binding protein